MVNRSRLDTRNDAVKMIIRILANSLGWMLNTGVTIQFLEPLTEVLMPGRNDSIAGAASSAGCTPMM